MSSLSMYRRRAKELESSLEDANARIQELETAMHRGACELPAMIGQEIKESERRAHDLAAECEVLLTALRPFAEVVRVDLITPNEWQYARDVYANSLVKK